MESKKVKVKLVVGYKQYRVIEVEESEVEKIREVNRMTWRELKQEVRKKESMVLQWQRKTTIPMSFPSMSAAKSIRTKRKEVRHYLMHCKPAKPT